MKTHMVTGPNISGRRLHGEFNEQGTLVARISGPQFSRDENYYTNPERMSASLRNGRIQYILRKLRESPDIADDELLALGADKSLIPHARREFSEIFES